ncbi:hypothetical protein Taro_029871 [Colocasia esculenta]|uniref:NB-ARC domain-containing protein n=1 Tax=Colocasia esculenta TaxID=4460 RepID=A0A843VMH6_COLES|nr:hypothetical protein [Colocasia esculenta]
MDPTDDSVRLWLRKLDGVADAAEDVLDEFPQQAMHLRLIVDSDEDAIDGGEKPMRIETIISRFIKIKKPEQALQREIRNGQIHAETMSARRATTSATQEPHIFGRDEDLANVKKFMLSSDTEEFSESDDVDVPVMAIVGMGGLGKTTLAQLAYHDDEVNQHFQLKSWVCASENFDVIQLTKAMVEPFDQEACHMSELDPLHQKLKRILERKRFLLVFDDVWEVDKFSSHWNLLTAPLQNSYACSKIILTTRNSKVFRDWR